MRTYAFMPTLMSSVSTYSMLLLLTVQQSVHLQKAVHSCVFMHSNQSLTQSTLLLYLNTFWTLSSLINLHHGNHGL